MNTSIIYKVSEFLKHEMKGFDLPEGYHEVRVPDSTTIFICPRSIEEIVCLNSPSEVLQTFRKEGEQTSDYEATLTEFIIQQWYGMKNGGNR